MALGKHSRVRYTKDWPEMEDAEYTYQDMRTTVLTGLEETFSLAELDDLTETEIDYYVREAFQVRIDDGILEVY